jgi:hypothetical protein
MSATLLALGLSCLMAGICLAGAPKPAITNAVDATTRAIAAANQAIADRTSRRFGSDSGIATQRGQFWTWRGRIGYRKGDLEVVVTLRSDGQVVHTEVAEWITIPQWRY